VKILFVGVHFFRKWYTFSGRGTLCCTPPTAYYNVVGGTGNFFGGLCTVSTVSTPLHFYRCSEREGLLGELEEWNRLREGQRASVSPPTAETPNPVVNPYSRPSHTPVPVINPYARPSSACSSNNPEVVPSLSTPNTSRNASGRIVWLSGASQQSFNVGDRVKIINDLYRTLRRTPRVPC